MEFLWHFVFSNLLTYRLHKNKVYLYESTESKKKNGGNLQQLTENYVQSEIFYCGIGDYS